MVRNHSKLLKSKFLQRNYLEICIHCFFAFVYNYTVGLVCMFRNSFSSAIIRRDCTIKNGVYCLCSVADLRMHLYWIKKLCMSNW